jgi:DNA processing protein
MADTQTDPRGQETADTTLGLRSRGRWPLPLGPRVAIVGSRRPTPYGVAVAERLAADLTSAGVLVVAGLALGIDAAAHEGALQAGGCTIAILGTGVDVVHPTATAGLADRILIAGGALVSPFPDGTGPRHGNFLRCTRTIAALSDLVVVVETHEVSGTLVTAEAARGLRKPVMAVPGSVFSPLSVGSHKLLQDGAGLVQNATDVLAGLADGRASHAIPCREDIEPQLRAAEQARAEAHIWRRDAQLGPPPHYLIPLDDQGRTPTEAYLYCCGLVDAYSAMLAELTSREARS